MMRRIGATGATILLIALVACGDPDDPGAQRSSSTTTLAEAATDSTAIKACDVVSESELETILGVELQPPRLVNDYLGTSQCRWDLSGDAQRGVSISLREQGDLAIYERVPGSLPTSGLGDAGVWHPTNGQLAVQTGARVLSIAVMLEGEAQRPQAEAIARIALEKI